MSENTISVEKKELEEIVDKKIEQRLAKNNDKKTRDSESKVSRREFIKKMGLGALGIGAASMIPNSAALDIKDDQGLEVYSDGSKHFNVNPGGPVQVNDANFLVKGSNLQRSFAATLSSHKLNDGEFTALDRFTVPSGSKLRIYIAGITNDSFNTPSGLNIVVRNQSTGANELTYNLNHSEGEPLDELTGVGGDQIVLAADNGNFESGTGTSQIATARIKYEII